MRAQTRPVLSRPVMQQIVSGLHARVWRLSERENATTSSLIFLGDGAAAIDGEQGSEQFVAPSLIWLSRANGRRLTSEAGSTGYLARIGDDLLSRAVGDLSESAILRFMTDRDQRLPIAPNSRHFSAVSASLSAMQAELEAPQVGTEMLLVAHLRAVLVAMLRLSGVEELTSSNTGARSQHLLRFRQLVEGNFRSHWPIARYAELIGISHDRLHAICTRVLGKSPKALVAERLAREAAIGLERSALTVEQLSNSLGFRDPAHFSHFFKRMTGMAPGAFRRMMAQGSADRPGASPANFADWP